MSINGINPNAAIGAYLNTQQISGGEGQVTKVAGLVGNPATISNPLSDSESVSFSDFLENKVGQAVETMQRGEELSAKAVTGEANPIDVVQAVTAAEVSLQTLVAVRDKMISAYQEVMRMSI